MRLTSKKEIEMGGTKSALTYLKAPLANLGFLLQISGFLNVPSLIYALHLDELNVAIALLIPTLILLSLGFLCNALCERKSLNLQQSSALLVLFFILVPLINSIPYLYLKVFNGNIFDQLLNSFFETMSAISTTGLTLLEGVTLPRSMILARGINEWVGGIGITFILLSFFYQSKSLFHYGKILGIEKITKNYKRSFLCVLLIYIVYTFIFSIILIFLGLEPFTAFHTTFTTFSTTGLTIVNVLMLPVPVIVVITIMMLLSAFSFSFHLNFFKRKWRDILNEELIVYIAFLLVFTLLFWYQTDYNIPRAFFHIVDMSSSGGLNLVNFGEIGEVGKIILVVVMLIGPCAFSVGGGIRVLRLVILGKAIIALPQKKQVKIGGRYVEKSVVATHLLIFLLFISISFLAALVLSNYGYSFSDALVESTSAITTTGDSPKMLTPTLPFVPKFLLIMLMFAGRIEFLPIYITFSRAVKLETG